MDTKEFYQLIGQITYSFANIDFLISEIAVDFALVKSYPEFYAKWSFKKKIEILKNRSSKVIDDKVVLNEFLVFMEELEDLRKKRNNLVHSITLNNKSEYVSYNFSLQGKNIRQTFIQFTDLDLRQLNTDFINTHNKIYTIWRRYITSKRDLDN